MSFVFEFWNFWSKAKMIFGQFRAILLMGPSKSGHSLWVKKCFFYFNGSFLSFVFEFWNFRSKAKIIFGQFWVHKIWTLLVGQKVDYFLYPLHNADVGEPNALQKWLFLNNFYNFQKNMIFVIFSEHIDIHWNILWLNGYLPKFSSCGTKRAKLRKFSVT